MHKLTHFYITVLHLNTVSTDVSSWGIEENIRGLFSQFILHTIYWYKLIFNIKNCDFFVF